jgi:hypothetical protein
MKTSWFFVVLFSLCFATSTPAKEASWTGKYTDKKHLNGQAVFQLNILQEGDKISVDFDAVYNDGHGCAPEANAQIVDQNTLRFTFTDTSNNAGTGTIKRTGAGVIISVEPTRVADPRCVIFYKETSTSTLRVSAAHVPRSVSAVGTPGILPGD